MCHGPPPTLAAAHDDVRHQQDCEGSGAHRVTNANASGPTLHGEEPVEKLLTTNLTSTDTTERNAGWHASRPAPESEARQAVAAARYQAKVETGDLYLLGPLHPAVQAVRTIGDRLNVVAAAADSLSLRMEIIFVTLHASGAAMSSTASEESKHEQQMSEGFRKAIELLGDDLCRLA
jgi:hypothetical protein